MKVSDAEEMSSQLSLSLSIHYKSNLTFNVFINVTKNVFLNVKKIKKYDRYTKNIFSLRTLEVHVNWQTSWSS